MADFKTKYGSTAQAITITLNSLASSATAGRQSTEIDNTSNLFIDAMVSVAIKLPTSGSIANDKTLYVYAWGVNDTTTPTRPAEVASSSANSQIGASDAAYTFGSDTPLRLIGRVGIPTLNTSANGVIISNPMSVRAGLGLMALPPLWGIVVLNYCGVTLHSSGNSAWYQGVLVQSA